MSDHSSPEYENGSPHERPPRLLSGLSIRHKLVLSICLLLALVLTTGWLILRNQTALTLQQQADSLGSTLAAQAADSVTEPVLANDQLSLNVILNQLTRNPSITHAVVLNVDNEVIASAGSAPSPARAQDFIAYSAPVALQDAVAGTVRLTLDAAHIGNTLQQSSRYFWMLLGLGLLLAMAAALALGNHISAPLVELVRILLDPQARQALPEVRRGDEIGLLQQACANLLARCEAHEQQEAAAAAAARQDPGMASQSLDGQRLQASVLWLQVSNINTAIELLHPSTLSRLLSEYFGYLERAASLYGGRRAAYGEGKVCLLFDLRSGTDHACQAICCARLFQEVMKKVNLDHRQAGSPTLDFKAGIHSGDVFLTSTTLRDEPCETVLGQALAVSRQLSSVSPHGQVMLSESTFTQAGGEDIVHFHSSGEIDLPGSNSPLMAYLLQVISQDQEDRLAEQVDLLLDGQSSPAAPPSADPFPDN